MTRSVKVLTVLGLALALHVVTPAMAQGNDDATADDGCGPVEYPCWMVVPLGIAALLFLVAIVRSVVLARRIVRGPERPTDTEIPPELRDDADPQPSATTRDAPMRSPASTPFTSQAQPWPDERHGIQTGRSPALAREPPSEQVTWGDHRLWFDSDGQYVFSVDVDVPEDWLPCFSIPKGHRIVVSADRVPKLERFDPRHP